jgi:uncharacterized protein YqhQ
MADRYAPIGGQAVIEGVMMRSPKRVATAVRLPDGSIQVKTREYVSLSRRYPILGLPILRGAVVLIESLRIGVESLAFSAEMAVEVEKERPNGERRYGTLGLGMGFTVLFSFAAAFLIFFYLPLKLTDLTGVRDPLGYNLIDGGIRLFFFLIYILAIGLWGEMRRVFQYHGAEHKTIHNLESGEDLSPEVAGAQSRFHPRCGTSFLFLVVIVSFIVFAFLGRPDTIGARALRFALIPVIAGLSFEIIRFAGAHYDNPLVRWLSEPGLQLQRLTTREPSRDMLEVAIAALRAVL